jgi:hypothetical protein
MLLNSGQKFSNGQIIPAEMDKLAVHPKIHANEINDLREGNGQKLPVRSLAVNGKLNELRRPKLGRRCRRRMRRLRRGTEDRQNLAKFSPKP